jgi:hypothetical protein
MYRFCSLLIFQTLMLVLFTPTISAQDCCEELFKRSQESGYPYSLGIKLNCVTKIENKKREGDDVVGRAKCLLLLAMDKQMANEFLSSQALLDTLTSRLDSTILENSYLLGSAYNLAGYNYDKLGFISLAESAYVKSIKFYTKIADSDSVAYFALLLNRGNLLKFWADCGRYRLAIEEGKELRRLTGKLNSHEGRFGELQSLINNNLGYAYSLMSINLLFDRHDSEGLTAANAAHELFYENLRFVNRIKEDENIPTAYINLVASKLLAEDYKGVIDSCQSILNNIEKLKNLMRFLKSYLYSIYSIAHANKLEFETAELLTEKIN